MPTKSNTLKDRFPEGHPIFKIHKYSESQNSVTRNLKFALSAVTVFVILLPFEFVRIGWALLLNVFTNHIENYLFYIKRAYTAILSEIASFVCYFVFFLFYAVFRKMAGGKPSIDIVNTDKESCEYQS